MEDEGAKREDSNGREDEGIKQAKCEGRMSEGDDKGGKMVVGDKGRQQKKKKKRCGRLKPGIQMHLFYISKQVCLKFSLKFKRRVWVSESKIWIVFHLSQKRC